jgi:hypothetical protein
MCNGENADLDLWDFYDYRVEKINRKMQTWIYGIFMIIGLKK